MVTIIGEITERGTIAIGQAIREVGRLVRVYGAGRWRKCRGIAWVRLPDGSVCRAEVHWYEALRVGRKELKVKRLVRD